MKSLFATILSITATVDGDPIDCMIAASNHEDEFIRKNAAILCAKAESLAPIQCVQVARQTDSFPIQAAAVELCEGAINDAPVSCAIKAMRSGSYTIINEFKRLCSGLRKQEGIKSRASDPFATDEFNYDDFDLSE